MAEINLLDNYPKSNRPIEARGVRKLAGEGSLKIKREQLGQAELLFEQLLLARARQFGREYFDGDRLYGYGGYYYNPKYWTGTVQRLSDYYQLKNHAAVLDVGCAKGFLLYDFKRLVPQVKVAGLDISEYAYDQAPPEIKPFFSVGNAKELPYEDNSFDLVLSIYTVDHLPLEESKQAIREIMRVSKKNAFIAVNAWRNKAEKEKLLKWNLTAQTVMHVDDWKNIFASVGYKGDYYWFLPD